MHIDPIYQLYQKGHIINGYEVVDIIHNQGMSVIYEVLDSDKRTKILKSPKDSDDLKFLVNESRIITDLNQKNINGIVKSYEPFEHEEVPFLPLEKLETEIEDYLNERYYFRNVGVFIDSMADVLSSLKKEGIVHRDIKPGNIMGDKKENLKLFDFGAAYDMIEKGLKRYGKLSSLEELYQQKPSELIKKTKFKFLIIPGTPGYIAPELLRGSLPLPCSDMYSFGKTLARLLLEKGNPEEYSGLFGYKLIYPGEAEEHKVDLINKVKTVTLLPKTLETILEATLSPDPDERPTPRELEEMNIEYMKQL